MEAIAIGKRFKQNKATRDFIVGGTNYLEIDIDRKLTWKTYI